MERVISDILEELRKGRDIDASQLDAIIRRRSAEAHDGRRVFAKKRILPFYLATRAENGALWSSWNVDEDLDERFVKTLQMKPRRSASGVATVTVITKPWPCANACVYCPNDPAMPKSYLSDEPACQRAALNEFDPYRQVANRLHTLEQMGHATDKVELIVLGGTWLDYPADYRIWFISELFRALNDGPTKQARTAASDKPWEPYGPSACERPDPPQCTTKAVGPSPRSSDMQIPSPRTADRPGSPSHSSGTQGPSPRSSGTPDTSRRSSGTLDPSARSALASLHAMNEHAAHRCVGLVVETRPDTITPATLTELRSLGCTKIQLGVQSIRNDLLRANGRRETVETIREAFALCRLFGFKVHAHFMVNLLGATPESDIADYHTFANDAPYQPDEVKLYPCALVESAPLVAHYRDGSWRPYTEDELVGVLSANLIDTPAFTRVSRMIRDISSNDILVGNKKTNLRQLVEQGIADTQSIREIRFRETGTEPVDLEALSIDEVTYDTGCTMEHFLQWVTPEGKIAGFLRLSLPHEGAIERYEDELPQSLGTAMIREVHVYGFATRISADGPSVQHHGLGRTLVERACDIARAAGYPRINVISAVGTRDYYRKLGFHDDGLYQQRQLI